jgi:transcription-repair coupling factor
VKWSDPDKPVASALLDAIAETRALDEITSVLIESDRAVSPTPPHLGLLGLRGSACTIAAAHLARTVTRRRRGPLVYLVPDHSTLEDVREDFIFLLGRDQVTHFPELSVPPYSFRIPKSPVRAARIETLARLLTITGAESEKLPVQVILATPEALYQKIPTPDHFRRFVKELKTGEQMEMDDLIEALIRLGFTEQTLVGEYGDFSRRGGIIDIYSYGLVNPVRIEFDDDEIASLREFDVATQRSLSVLPAMTVLPLWEVIVDESNWDQAESSGFIPAEGPLREHLDDLRSEGNFEGLEWMLGGLQIPLGTILDYAGKETVVIAEDPALIDRRLEEARFQVRELSPHGDSDSDGDSEIDSGESWSDEDIESLPALFSQPDELFVMYGSIRDLLKDYPVIHMGVGTRTGLELEDDESSIVSTFSGDRRGKPQEATDNNLSFDVPPVEAGEENQETPPENKGWTASEQLNPPDPLEDDLAKRKGAAEWRAMLARNIRGGKRSDPSPGKPLPGGPDIPDEEFDAAQFTSSLSWSDQAEASMLMAYTPRYYTIQTKPQSHFGRNLDLVRDYIKDLRGRGMTVAILCDTPSHRDRLEELMGDIGATFVVGNLAGGFEIPDLKLAVLTDHEIFQRIRRRRVGRRYSRGISLKELLAMRLGDFVVHIEHGIGVYRGIDRLTVNGHLTDCMKIEYAKGDKLFIPVDQLNLVQKYSAEEGAAPSLSRIGGKQWAKTKAKVKKSIKEMADELIKLYARRKAQPGHPFPSDTVWQTEMEACFPYDETVDQLTAIEAVKKDMETPTPMDRLICGDVGYGKTEVAIRAAFKAVMDGKQVGVLVPTTLLTQQHFDTFRERLKGFPVRVDMLSRFRTAKEIQATVKDMSEGKVDIVIGTHRLVSKDVKFSNLGLVIIDEEQRFGVKHKEKLKQMRTQVDVLTLTATPIPRTMNLSLMGARDMSTINSPPRDRRPIRTEIAEFNDELITYALMNEADRGGQSFFVHNRVESIGAMSNYIRSLVPHLRVAVAHGQMPERKLEDVMRKFLAGEYDVLVSTMIIESGLDLPNVNTIVVNRTDTFGLAQLYQLRGRVGRSARKAYAYLLIPPDKVLTETAMKRLKAIEEFEDLGSGFQLAMRDLEIRGSGNLLGTQQHGFIVNVGFELYTRLLEEAIKELKGEPVEEKTESRIVTDIEAFLPTSYVSNDPEKMNLYKSLADANTVAAVDQLSAELTDRFGKMPLATENLFELRRLRLRASGAGVETLTLRDGAVRIELARSLMREDIKRLISQMPIPVVFRTHGAHRVEAEAKEVQGEVLLVAGQILECLEPAPA